MGCGQGFFKIRDAFDLAGPEVLDRQRIVQRQVGQTAAQGVRFGGHDGKGFRPVEREEAARTWFGIAFIPEIGFDAGGLIEKREDARGDGLDEIRQVFSIVAGLLRDTGEERALLLGLDHAHGLAVHQQEVIAGTGFERRFAKRDASGGGGVELLIILNSPATRSELRVDLFTGFLFSCDTHI